MANLGSESPNEHIGYYFQPHPLKNFKLRSIDPQGRTVKEWIRIPDEPAYLQVVSVSKDERFIVARDPVRIRHFRAERKDGHLDVQEVPVPERPERSGAESRLKRSYAWKSESAESLTERIYQQQKDIKTPFEPRDDLDRSNLKKAIAFAVQKLHSGEPFTLETLEAINRLLSLGESSTDRYYTWPSEVVGLGILRGTSPRHQTYQIHYRRTASGGWEQMQGRLSTYRVDVSRAQKMNHSPPLFFVPAEEVPTRLAEWLDRFNRISDQTPISEIADLRIGYIAIHPALDGNGRESRILLDLMLMKAGFNGLNHQGADSRSVLYRTRNEIIRMISENILP